MLIPLGIQLMENNIITENRCKSASGENNTLLMICAIDH